MSYGAFSGNPKTEWLAEGGGDRKMRLIDEFWYDDPAGRRWRAPQGSVVDGASIPESLWSSIGSPYTGDYRRASIVHDIACETPGVPREAADEMFYWACIAGGCSRGQAKMLYVGVRIGAWASGTGLMALDELALKPRLANEHTPNELLVRAKYTVLAARLAVTSDDFAAIKGVVDEELNR